MFREFAHAHSWVVAAQTADLSQRLLRPPRTSVVGSAQADLTIRGEWGATAASVSSVLVQREGPFVPTNTRERDEVVLLVTLETAADPRQWLARRAGDVITFTPTTPEAAPLEQPVLETLRGPQSREAFADGDSLAAGDAGLWLVHLWDRPPEIDDISPRLDLLAGMARAISAWPAD